MVRKKNVMLDFILSSRKITLIWILSLVTLKYNEFLFMFFFYCSLVLFFHFSLFLCFLRFSTYVYIYFPNFMKKKIHLSIFVTWVLQVIKKEAMNCFLVKACICNIKVRMLRVTVQNFHFV